MIYYHFAFFNVIPTRVFSYNVNCMNCVIPWIISIYLSKYVCFSILLVLSSYLYIYLLVLYLVICISISLLVLYRPQYLIWREHLEELLSQTREPGISKRKKLRTGEVKKRKRRGKEEEKERKRRGKDEEKER